ncbi:MAG: AAA family ATPase [Trueperaceae bacterium]|nr:AAA family ATPase [Trueperaceae bacterium]
MRLRRLKVERLAGIDGQIDLQRLAPGVNVVVGPNASGKSSLVRALLALLYPRETPGSPRLSAEFSIAGGVEISAERLGDETTWTRGHGPAAAPNLIPWESCGAYFLRLEDLVLEPHPVRPGRGKPSQPATGPTDLDRAVSRAIGRELTGGIDLAAVAKGFGKLENKGNVAAAELRERLRELDRLRAVQAEIHQREDRLPELEEELERARVAAEGAGSVREALALAAEVRNAAQLEERVAQYGSGFDVLDERAAERLESALVAETEEKRRALREREEAVRLAAELSSLELPEPVPSSAAIREYAEAARELRSKRAELDEIEAQGAQTHSELRSVQRQLGVEVGAAGPADLTLPALAKVEATVERRLVAALRVRSLEEESSAAPADDPAKREGSGGSDSDLADAERALAAWLDAGSKRWRSRWAWLGGGLVTGVALYLYSRYLSLVDSWPAWAPPYLVGGLAASVLLALLTAPWTSARRVAARRVFEGSGLIGPERWSEAAVIRRLAEVTVEAESRRRAKEQWLRHEVRREQSHAQLERARADLASAVSDIAALRSEIGYEPDLPDAGIAAWLQAHRSALELRGRLAGLKAKRAEVARSLAEGTRAIAIQLASSGALAAPLPDEAGPDELIAACKSVEERLRRGEELKAQLLNARRGVAAAVERLKTAKALTKRLLTDLELAPEDLEGSRIELQRRMRSLPEWRRLTQDLAASIARCEVSKRRLEGRGDLLELAERAASAPEGAEANEAERELRSALDAAGSARLEAERLSEQVFNVKRDSGSAVSNRALERAAGAVAQARDQLAEHRAQAMRLALGGRLVEDLAQRHSAGVQPAALELAREWFARFTAGRYRLDLASGAGTAKRLVAFDHETGEVRELGELSTGTRTQLLLASRVAYALVEETRSGREPLPLFLDEALTTADPERFSAVALSLLELAASGRQVFYLSARPEDAGAWREAAERCAQSVNAIELQRSTVLEESTPQVGQLGGARG